VAQVSLRQARTVRSEGHARMAVPVKLMHSGAAPDAGGAQRMPSRAEEWCRIGAQVGFGRRRRGMRIFLYDGLRQRIRATHLDYVILWAAWLTMVAGSSGNDQCWAHGRGCSGAVCALALKELAGGAQVRWAAQ
jgi:hypothetical protein